VPPLVAQSGPPGYQKGIEIDSAMDGVAPAPIDLDSPEGCGFRLGTRDENAPSGEASENPGPTILDEAMRPLQECVQPVSGGTQGQSSRGKISNEKRCPPSVPEQGAHSSECRELDMGVPPNIDGSTALDPVGTQGSAALSETND
jgi:hypothetical protein